MPKKSFNIRLEILGDIAKGGQARVVLARSLSGRLVALKYFYDPLIFYKEAYYLRQLDHDLITRFLGTVASKSSRALLSEYVLGANLAILQDIRLRTREVLSTELLVYFMQQILKILAYLESVGIVHGDLAAENILASPKGHVKLCDFGAAHGASFLTGPHGTFGRRDFLAPEILAGEDSSHWSDLYAFGAVIFEIIMQRRFSLAQRQADLLSLRERLRSAPTVLYYLISSCLAPSPLHRPASAALARLRLVRLSHVDVLRAQHELGLWARAAYKPLISREENDYIDFYSLENRIYRL